jgi:hypothetical protein
MKQLKPALLLAAALCLAAILSPLFSHAQTLPAGPVPAILATETETAADYNLEALPTDLRPASPSPTIIADLAVKYPLFSTVVFLVGILRLVVKPIMAAIQSHVAGTPDTADDERFARVQRSWWLRAILFILDWGASVKPVK